MFVVLCFLSYYVYTQETFHGQAFLVITRFHCTRIWCETKSSVWWPFPFPSLAIFFLCRSVKKLIICSKNSNIRRHQTNIIVDSSYNKLLRTKENALLYQNFYIRVTKLYTTKKIWNSGPFTLEEHAKLKSWYSHWGDFTTYTIISITSDAPLNPKQSWICVDLSDIGLSFPWRTIYRNLFSFQSTLMIEVLCII